MAVPEVKVDVAKHLLDVPAYCEWLRGEMHRRDRDHALTRLVFDARGAVEFPALADLLRHVRLMFELRPIFQRVLLEAVVVVPTQEWATWIHTYVLSWYTPARPVSILVDPQYSVG